jgi:ribosomal protein S18 acetylase RimI-like enzyme
VTKPTVERPSIGQASPVAGLPPESSRNQPSVEVKYQRVYHLNTSNALTYDALTYPSLQQRWQQKPPTGELLGISAAIDGSLVGFAISEQVSAETAEIISLLVLPDYRHQGIGTKLLAYLERELRQQGCQQLTLSYPSSSLTQAALEPILQKLHWQPPQTHGEFRYTQKSLNSMPPIEGSSVHFNGVERLAGNLSSRRDLGSTDQGEDSTPSEPEVIPRDPRQLDPNPGLEDPEGSSEGSSVHFNGVERLAGNLSSRRDLSPTDPESLPLQSPKSPSPPTIQYLPLGNLTIEQSLTYNPLTFPKIQTRWSRQQPKGPLVGIVATVSGENVGLVLAEVFATQPNTPPEAEVISLFVLPPYRHQGIGTGLMQNLEAGLRTLNCTRMKLAYKSSSTTTLALEPLLKRQHWQDPTVNFVLGKTTTQKVSQAPWLHKYPLSDKFTVFPWSELTDADRQHIQTLDYPTSLSPFGNTPAEPLNSLGLRYDGQLVGWMVTHRVATDAIRYSTMFVDKRFQRLGRGISLLSESIRRQASSGVPYCLFAVAEDNSAMQRFIHRHLEAYLTELSESRVGVKVLFY